MLIDNTKQLKEGSFQYLEEKIRTGNNLLDGRKFESLVKSYLLSQTPYKDIFKDAWLWGDWPNNWGRDKGIDIVAETKSGRLWAIQCKFYSKENTLTKRDIDSFLSESNRAIFNHRLLITTAEKLSENARETIESQEKSVGVIMRGDLLASSLVWPKDFNLSFIEIDKKTPRKHQREAIDNTVKGFSQYDKGQLIMASGTGKTLTALWIAEELKTQSVLFLVPSLTLLAQTILEWTGNSKLPFEYLCLCSDKTVNKKNYEDIKSYEIGSKITTEKSDIALFLEETKNIRTVIFSTYQSAFLISELQMHVRFDFDLVICDEAHRTAGLKGRLFSIVVDDNLIKSKKKLFMTATPRIYSESVIEKANEKENLIYTMDDEGFYGRPFYALTFHEAVERGLLSDYRIIITTVTNENIKRYIDTNTIVKMNDETIDEMKVLAGKVAFLKSIVKYNLTRIITYHSSIKKALSYTIEEDPSSLTSINKSIKRDINNSRKLVVGHLNGKTPANKRQSLLNELGNSPDDKINILTNVSCLTEGVDVPNLDSVVFFDPKESIIDIVQATGRVLRKGNKKIGYVVIPIFLGEGEGEVDFSAGQFKTIWKTVCALKAQDNILYELLNEARDNQMRGKTVIKDSYIDDRLIVDIPIKLNKAFHESLYIKLINATTNKPDLDIGLILDWCDEFYKKNSEWPQAKHMRTSLNKIPNSGGETWINVKNALGKGARGLPRTTLTKILTDYRGVHSFYYQKDLTYELILRWADSYFKKTGGWPSPNSGKIDGEENETWYNVHSCMYNGRRNFPEKITIIDFLKRERNAYYITKREDLTLDRIWEWAQEHFEENGKWPTQYSGVVASKPDETWRNINSAFGKGSRGLSSEYSVARLIKERAGLDKDIPISELLKWCDNHFKEKGKYPRCTQDIIPNSGGLRWKQLDSLMRSGSRGFAKGTTLRKFLVKHRGERDMKNLPDLSEKRIKELLLAYYEKHNQWPKSSSEEIADPETKDSWQKISYAFVHGKRGLYKSSLRLFINENLDSSLVKEQLTVDKILNWADAFFKKHGEYPKQRSGVIPQSKNDTWMTIETALREDRRGMRGEKSLYQFLKKHRNAD